MGKEAVSAAGGITMADLAAELPGAELLNIKADTTKPEASASDALSQPTAIGTDEEHGAEEEEPIEQLEEEESEEPDPDDPDDDEEEESEEGKATPKTIEKMQKRIDTLTRKHKEKLEKLEPRLTELEQDNQRLSAELEGAKTERIPVTPENPLANIFGEAQLEEQLEKSRRIRSWARSNLQSGATIKGANGEDVDLTPEEVQAYYDQHDEVLTNYGPKRRVWIQNALSTESSIREALPQYFDPKSVEYQAMKKAMQANPQLLGDHDCVEKAIKFALGETAYADLLKSKKPEKPAKPAVRPAPTAPVVPSPGAVTPRTDGPKKTSAQPAVKKAVESGNRADMSSAVEAMLT